MNLQVVNDFGVKNKLVGNIYIQILTELLIFYLMGLVNDCFKWLSIKKVYQFNFRCIKCTNFYKVFL